MKHKRDIFTFNHIDPSIDEERLLEIKALYRFYHKKWWCYKKTFRRFKRMNLFCKMSSSFLIATGTIAGGITLNPVTLGVVAGAGLLLKTYADYKNYNRRIEMSKYAYTTYQKVLIDLRSCMRGKHFDHDSFVDEMRLIDDMISDLCTLSNDKIEEKYERIFTSR